MSLRLIDSREDHRPTTGNMALTLTKYVRKSLPVDTYHRAEAVAEEIGAFLETPKGAP